MSPWLYLLQQAACAWSLLIALGLTLGLRRGDPWRLLLTALGCGCVSLLAAVWPHPLMQLLSLIFLTLVAPLAAWPGVPRSRRLSLAVAAMLLSLLMTGCARLLHPLGLGRTPLVLLLFALVPVLAYLMPQAAATRCITLNIAHWGRQVRLSALVDSGNLLRDPLTGLPIIVISRRAAERIVHLPTEDSLPPGMRLISVRTVAGTALMPIFRPQQASLLLPDGWRAVDALIGLSPEGYSGFQALVPSCLITSQGGLSYVYDL